jgi:hypothetical protein
MALFVAPTGNTSNTLCLADEAQIQAQAEHDMLQFVLDTNHHNAPRPVEAIKAELKHAKAIAKAARQAAKAEKAEEKRAAKALREEEKQAKGEAKLALRAEKEAAKAAQAEQGDRSCGGSRYLPQRPSKLELTEWASSLESLEKFSGICSQRYHGKEFKKVLMELVEQAGGSLKPSDLRSDRHHPSQLNQKASALCLEAGTQATCECHSAGPKSVKERIQLFLAEAASQGLKRVNVVTGLGGHGGGGTIRQLMPEILEEDPLVARFELASNFAAVYADLI